MSKISELDNLCGPGKPLRQEPVDARECENLVLSGGMAWTSAIGWWMT